MNSLLSKVSLKKVALGLFAFGAMSVASVAQAQVRIAVTDLSYQETVARYFNEVSLSYKGNAKYENRDRYSDTDRRSSGNSSEKASGSVDMQYHSKQGTELVIERGELRKFTSDIKGGLLKNGFRVVQGKPWTAKNTETLYDIIGRIKKGYYPNTDYVLFGTVNSVDFRDENNAIQGSNAVNMSRNLELTVEFSLINVKTYEVKAAFSAIGEGSESKLVSGMNATNFNPSTARIMKQVTESLGEDVSRQVLEQFPQGSAMPEGGGMSSAHAGVAIEQHSTVREYK